MADDTYSGISRNTLNMRNIQLIIPLLAVVTLTAFGQSTTRRHLKPVKEFEVVEATPQVAINRCDTLTDASQINEIARLSDFKKATASRVESVLITNLSTTDTIHAIDVEIDYRTVKGKQLNKRNVTFKVIVPPGQTRHASVASWDRQQLFYHTSTPPTRKSQRTTAFKVTLNPYRLIVSESKK